MLAGGEHCGVGEGISSKSVRFTDVDGCHDTGNNDSPPSVGRNSIGSSMMRERKNATSASSNSFTDRLQAASNGEYSSSNINGSGSIQNTSPSAQQSPQRHYPPPPSFSKLPHKRRIFGGDRRFKSPSSSSFSARQCIVLGLVAGVAGLLISLLLLGASFMSSSLPFSSSTSRTTTAHVDTSVQDGVQLSVTFNHRSRHNSQRQEQRQEADNDNNSADFLQSGTTEHRYRIVKKKKKYAASERTYPRLVQYVTVLAELSSTNNTSVKGKVDENDGKDDMKSKDSRNKKHRKIKYPMVWPDYFDYLEDSREFRHRADRIEDVDSCVPQYEWQTLQYPTCNTVHEFDLASPYAYDNKYSNRKDNNSTYIDSKGRKRSRSSSIHPRELVRLIANGYWRDVWIVHEDASDQKRVVKTLRFAHDVNDRNIDRNRRDAMALEHLTKSKLVVGIYGYCSTSGLFEFSGGGDIYNALWPGHGEPHNLTSLDKLQIATQAAMGLADVHNIDKEGQASIAHTDISPDQFIQIDGLYRINDFNRARFIGKDVVNGTNCPYWVGKNPGKNRSPEEYRYDPQSEKVDVYSFGNVIYTLLMEETPFQEEDSRKVRKLVMKGIRPSVYFDVWNSTDPIIQTLKSAMIMCHEHEPEERASARKVATFLREKLESFDPGRLKKWGF